VLTDSVAPIALLSEESNALLVTASVTTIVAVSVMVNDTSFSAVSLEEIAEESVVDLSTTPLA
jgi:hypothetical protein